MVDYTVSVRLMTYNHELFIRDAIESVLNQKANFNIEVVIGDDFSTDSTLTIIKEYNNTNNIHIHILEREIGGSYWKARRAHGRLFNFSDILENCSGKYVALLDGDDYWIDPLKLQKQVDFLETHPDYSMCFHQANIDFQDGSIKKYNDFNGTRTFQFHDLIERNFVSTASCVFRRLDRQLPDWFYDLQAGDWALHLLNAKRGKIFYMDDCASVYRFHNDGIWSQLSPTELTLKGIRNLQTLDKGFNFKYHEQFENAIKNRQKGLLVVKKKKNLLKIIKNKIRKLIRNFGIRK